MNSPTLYPFPFDRYDGSASNTTPRTSDPILQVEYPVPRFQPKPGQECWCQQRRVRARGAIDFHKIAWPEILDPCRIQRDHLRALRSLFVPRIEHHKPGRAVNRELTLPRIRGVVETMRLS
jgi:hypothetical protein